MATIKRSATTRSVVPNDPAYLRRLALEFSKAKEFAEKAAEHANYLKKLLSEAVDSQGDPDEKGNRWISIDGFDLKRERRVSRSLDVSRATEWAHANDHWTAVSEVVEQLSEDRLLTLAWERQDLASEVSALYSEKEVWAFKLIEKKTDEPEGDE
jgi:hypothetical protein